MGARSKGENLETAKKARVDEFYTQLSDIERELKHYRPHFVNKTVYLNCDDPRVSNFFHYFSYSFERLQLRKLIATCFKSQERDLFSQAQSENAIWLEYTGDRNNNLVPDPDEIGIKPLNGDGDFRSHESIELLKQADIVVTNPPFSLFREYLAQLIEHDKKFVIVGPKNALTYKDVFPLVQANQLWLGYGFQAGNAYFAVPDDDKEYAKGVYDPATGMVKFRNVSWYTNLDIEKRHEDLVLYETYSPEKFPTYANYDGIDVASVKNIPADYWGAMGVPITFLDVHNPDQFEILGNSATLSVSMSSVAPKGTFPPGGPRFYIANGDGSYKRMFERLVIRRKR